MIVTLDGQRVEGQFGPETTLESLIDQVRAMPPLKDRLIVSVAVDGERLDDDTLNSGLREPVADGAQVDLETSDGPTVVRGALLSLADQFELLGEQFDAIADRLTSGDNSPAMKEVAQVVSVWQMAYRAVAQCSTLLGEDLTGYQHSGRPVRDWLAELIDKLTELRRVLESRDMVMLADTVRYEFPVLTNTWQKLLIDLGEQVCPASRYANTQRQRTVRSAHGPVGGTTTRSTDRGC